MTKDVIYIDVEDDITTIVGKIKASKEKIIALVPPNRVGVLQSAVNMRLLQRSAEQVKKRVVLISNNQSLAALAAAAKIPVARNLQSKPELAEVPVLKVDNDDIIDGEKLPIGEIARSAGSSKRSEAVVDAAIKSNAIAEPLKKTAKPKASGKKVPDFSVFRKRLFLFGGLGILLIGFLVWAIWFAPRATVVITAKTTTTTVDRSVSLVSGGETDVEAGTVKSIRLEEKGDISVEFEATGEKNIGEKAKGTVEFSHQSMSSRSVAAGTRLTTNGGHTFTLDSAVTIPASEIGAGCFPIACPGTATGTVTAVEAGTKNNAATGSLSGASVDAEFTNPTTGGTDKMATVVSDEDIEKATSALDEKESEGLKDKLLATFGSSSVLIEDSYQESRSKPTSSVAVDAEATGPVTLKTTITASMFAIDKVDLISFLEDSIKQEIEGQTAQKIYDTGVDDVKFAQFTEGNDDSAATVRITANGTIGPEIDETQVKEQVQGKSYGDIQTSLESISGVDSVDTKFWPFWVRTVPNDVNRITVEFKLQDAS